MFFQRLNRIARRLQNTAKKYERLHIAREQRKAEFASLLNNGTLTGFRGPDHLKVKLNAAAKTSRLEIVYFTATWCGPCVHIGLTYTKLASKYPKSVFLKVDIDEAREAAAKWQIESIPSYYLWKDGRVVDEELQMRMNSLDKIIPEH
ncbi:TPR repeat-containing thioredoxin TDX-like [Salvia splendens]|uniref:TPR repeat-containing thioredoxin TDX-like n=1 Tax=Salvia splendens TaxID=180675 RepID=UPI001C280E3A|nr:TPR repeat-containing thioredoxin TDX-like [Salvia splendens]